MQSLFFEIPSDNHAVMIYNMLFGEGNKYTYVVNDTFHVGGTPGYELVEGKYLGGALLTCLLQDKNIHEFLIGKYKKSSEAGKDVSEDYKQGMCEVAFKFFDKGYMTIYSENHAELEKIKRELYGKTGLIAEYSDATM
jgi:hypothetical protein